MCVLSTLISRCQRPCSIARVVIGITMALDVAFCDVLQDLDNFGDDDESVDDNGECIIQREGNV